MKEKPTDEIASLKLRVSELEAQLSAAFSQIQEKSRRKQLQGWIRKASTLSLSATSAICAFLLGLCIFLFIRGMQWRSALQELRAEPGIEVLGVESAGFFRKRLVGLRDPLSRPVAEILAKNQINPNRVEIALSEYHSLNTPFEKEREQNSHDNLSALRDSLISVVGEFVEGSQNHRKQELEKMTRSLLELRFPEEMKSIDIEFSDGVWNVEGRLLTPAYEAFKAEAPKFIFQGKLRLDDLRNLTEIETSSLTNDIESLNLLARDEFSGKYIYVPRVGRLLQDLDAICDASGLTRPRLQIQLRAPNLDTYKQELETVRTALSESHTVDQSRFFPDSLVEATHRPDAEPANAGTKQAAHLSVISFSSPSLR